MAIRLRTAFRGTAANTIVTGLTAAEEAALIAAGDADRSLSLAWNYADFASLETDDTRTLVTRDMVLACRKVHAKRRQTLTKMQVARMAAAGGPTTQSTWHIETVTEGHFDGVRIGVLNNMTTTHVVGLGVAAATVLGASNSAATIDPTLNGGTWIDATYAGSGTGTVAAGAADLPSVTWSDWIGLSSLARTDGGTLPVLHIRLTLTAPASAPIPVYDSGSAPYQNLVNWEAESGFTGGRVWRTREGAGNLWTTKSSFVSTASNARHPVIVIQYISRKAGHTLLTIGDSITEASTGPTNFGDGWAHQMRNALSSVDRPIELANAGWGSQSVLKFSKRLAALIAADVKPSVLVYSPYSPNITVPTTATEAATWVAALGLVTQSIENSYGFPVVLWGALPTAAAVKNFGTSDSYRTAFHASLLGRANYVDVKSLVPVTAVGGQDEPATGYFSDGIHPNDALHTLMLGVIKPAVSALLV